MEDITESIMALQDLEANITASAHRLEDIQLSSKPGLLRDTLENLTIKELEVNNVLTASKAALKDIISLRKMVGGEVAQKKRQSDLGEFSEELPAEESAEEETS